jgi:sigma-54 specific flagellar transcriptional regulator A
VLFNHFWAQRGEQRSISPEVMRCLQAYSWPGNVRELENLVERLSVCSEGRVIRLSDLPPMVRGDGEITETRLIDQLERETLTAPPPSLAVPPAPPAPVAPVAPVAVAAPAVPAPAPGAAPPAFSTEEDSGVINVAELRDVTAELPGGPSGPAFDPSLPLPVDLPQLLRDLEMSYIAKALLQTGGNKKEAAKLLGMGRTTLVEKLRRRNTDASGT